MFPLLWGACADESPLRSGPLRRAGEGPGAVPAGAAPGLRQISPCASIASATSSKPAMFAPTT
ncbi:hypothetical protein GCM10010231_03530 [Streptomyces sindenensis]|nr:hypothetical protein GCM10010231_03530 [Streptomyces sindenensis]